MNLSEHFTLAEFTHSDVATRWGIDNTLPPTLTQHAVDTAHMMERIRAALSHQAGRDTPVEVTSAYRCLLLNRAIGSRDTSDHLHMFAVDFRAPAFGSPYDICQFLKTQVDALQIGQLIHEFGEWVHVSTKLTERPINRVLTITRAGTFAGVLNCGK